MGLTNGVAPTTIFFMKTLTPIREIIGNCLAVRVRIVARSVSAIYDQAMASHDVTVAQVNLLATLGEVGPCPPRKLGEVLQLERSTVSRNLELLIQKGLVEAVSWDAKGIREVILTEAGNEKIEAVLPDWRAAQKQAARLLGRDGVKAVHEASSTLFPY
jgi:DNA-binding MarR family transcriptional regulator